MGNCEWGRAIMQAIDTRSATIDCWLRRERISLLAKVLSGPGSDDIVYWELALDISAKNWQAQINLLTLRMFSEGFKSSAQNHSSSAQHSSESDALINWAVSSLSTYKNSCSLLTLNIYTQYLDFIHERFTLKFTEILFCLIMVYYVFWTS